MKYFKYIFLICATIILTTTVKGQDSFAEDAVNIDALAFAMPVAGSGNSAKSVIRFSLSGGASFQVFEVVEDDPELKDYLKKLKRGYYIQSDLCYVLSEYFSVGVKYNMHKSNNEIVDVLFTDGNGNTIVGSISDDITIGFAGVVLNGRIFSENNKNVLNAGIAVGSVNYKNDQVFLNTSTIVGNTIGMLYNIGYEYAMNERFGLGLNFNYSFGTITKIKENGVEVTTPGARVGTGRIQLGAIVVLHF